MIKNTNTNNYTPSLIEIYSVQFHVKGSDEIKAQSCANISNSEIVKDGVAVSNGVNSLSMGTTDSLYSCQSCQNSKLLCSGHAGNIALKYPVKSALYIADLLKWLKVICYNCGMPVKPIPKNVDKTRVLNELVKQVKNVTQCANDKCNFAYKTVSRSKINPLIFYRSTAQKSEQKDTTKKIMVDQVEYYNHEIKRTLDMVTDETCILLGRNPISHPRKYLLSTIEVLSIVARPELKKNNIRSSNSDTTHLLKTIIEHNNRIPDEIPENPEHFDENLKNTFALLDMTYYSMTRGGPTGDLKLQTNMNKAPNSIADRLPKKSGIIRKHLMGKKVNYMIRSVITGNTKLELYEVGVPVKHARNLEIPEVLEKLK